MRTFYSLEMAFVLECFAVERYHGNRFEIKVSVELDGIKRDHSYHCDDNYLASRMALFEDVGALYCHGYSSAG